MRQHRWGPGSKGNPRNGPALLAGIIVCGDCGRASRPTIGPTRSPTIGAPAICTWGPSRPVSASGPRAVDDLVTQQVLRALEPAALELSCRALEDVQRDRARLDKHWRQRLERARYEAEDAERHYRAVDPENRLVARSLEQRWEEALRAERQVRDDYDRFLRERPPQLSPEERARIAALSADLPALWHAPGTTHRDRKEIVRHLVDKVVVHVERDSEYVSVAIHWQGGFTSQHEVVRPVRSYEQLRDLDKLMDRIAALRHEGHTTAQIADGLNREGFSPPKRRRVLPRPGPPAHGAARPDAIERTHTEQLGPHEWWLPRLADAIPVTVGKLANWARRGSDRGGRPSNISGFSGLTRRS